MAPTCAGAAEAKLVAAPLQLATRRLLLCAVNDNPFVEVTHATHSTLTLNDSRTRLKDPSNALENNAFIM